MEAEIALDGAYVGESLGDVARLHRTQVEFGLASAGLLQQLDQKQQFLRSAVADIVDSMRRAAAARLAFAVIGRWVVEAGDYALHDIVDEREISTHFAM